MNMRKENEMNNAIASPSAAGSTCQITFMMHLLS